METDNQLRRFDTADHEWRRPGTVSGQIKKGDQGTNAAKADKGQPNVMPAVSDDLKGLFTVLDDFGQAAIKDAKPVELTLVNAEQPDRKQTKQAWLVSEDDKSVTVLEDDLIPWTYSKKEPTTIPASWNPAVVKLDSIHEADAEARFKQLSKKGDKPTERQIFAPGQSYRALSAHAAWKKGLTQYCNTIIAPDLEGKSFQEYRQAVLDDLAWLHYLRGVNLLMYADRGEVVKHLRLVSRFRPNRNLLTSRRTWRIGSIRSLQKRLASRRSMWTKANSTTKSGRICTCRNWLTCTVFNSPNLGRSNRIWQW